MPRRLLMTGTPIQNSLTELWALMQFCTGSIFGTLEQFSATFKEDGDPLPGFIPLYMDQFIRLISCRICLKLIAEVFGGKTCSLVELVWQLFWLSFLSVKMFHLRGQTCKAYLRKCAIRSIILVIWCIRDVIQVEVHQYQILSNVKYYVGDQIDAMDIFLFCIFPCKILIMMYFVF